MHTALFVPAGSAVMSLRRWWSTDIASLFHGPRLARENRDLEARIAALSEQNRELAGEAEENKRLRALLDFQTESTFKLLPAEVIAVKPSALRDSITLSRGDRDGVVQKMVALDPSGALLGQVVDVGHDSCDVLLLTDDLSSVGALIVPSRPGQAADPPPSGICRGERSTVLNLIDIPQNADIRPGDRVVTSGLGSVYPKGIPIGTVTSVSVDGATLLKSASVATDADFNDFDDALLVLRQAASRR